MLDLTQYTDKNEEVFPTGKIFRISVDPATAHFRIISSDPNMIAQIVDTYSATNPGKFYAEQYGYTAEDKLYVVNKFGYFPIGFLFEVLEYIQTMYGSTSCVAISDGCKKFIADYLVPLKPFASKIDKDAFEISNIAEDSGRNDELRKLHDDKLAQGIPENQIRENPYIFRDYQETSIRYLLFKGYGRGLIEIPTAGGKSFIIANFIHNLDKYYNKNLRYLIFVPNTSLVEQFYKDLLDFGFKQEDITRFTSTKFKVYNKDAKILIGNRQTIFKNLGKLPKIDVLIADEVHQSLSKSTKAFVENLNCSIKVGCSGTLPRDKYNRWQLNGMFGKILYVEDIVKLQESGFISKLKITSLHIHDETVENDRNLLFNEHSYRHYEDGGDIAFNESYNDELAYINDNYNKLYDPILAYIEKNLKGNVLVLFDRIEFGRNVCALAKENKTRNSNVYYIDGETPVDEREDIRLKLEESDNNILFANAQIMSTGVNIKRLNSIVFMFSTKSVVRVVQSIGRILRLHKEKDYAHLIDVNMNFKYSQKHFRERKKLYKQFYQKSKPDDVVTYTV